MATLRLACDRCHALKEKCIFPSSGSAASACSRCTRVASQCTTSRRKNEVGRPRKPETASTRPQAGTEFVWFGCPLQSAAVTTPPCPKHQPTSNAKPKPKPKPKPKTNKHEPPRPTQPPIIEPNQNAPRATTITTTATAAATPPPKPPTPTTRTTPLLNTLPTPTPTPLTLTPRQTHLLHAYLTNRHQITPFLLSAAFADAVLSHLCTTLVAAPDVLLDVSLACASRFARFPVVAAAAAVSVYAAPAGGGAVGVGMEVGVGSSFCGGVSRWGGGHAGRAALLGITTTTTRGDGWGYGDDERAGGNGLGGDGGGRGGGVGAASDLVKEHGLGLGETESAAAGEGIREVQDIDADDARSYYVHGTKAVKILREMEVDARKGLFGDREVVLALTLGLSLMTFDLLDSGLWAHEMCRFTLGLVERRFYSSSGERRGELWTYRAGRDPVVDAGLVPFVCMDVSNCLIRRQLPLCRLELGSDKEQWVDRYLGLCGPLLAVLFDLCRLSHQLGTLETLSENLAAPAREAILAELEETAGSIIQWNPQIPEPLALASTPDEVWAIQAQARIYKTLTLLVIHRLRYGFGTQDDEARQLSRAILNEIDDVYIRQRTDSLDGNGQTDLVDHRLRFPLFIAAVELEDPGERISALGTLRSAVCNIIYPQVTERMGQALAFAWDFRDKRRCTHWSGLVPTSMPPFVLF